MFIQYELYDQCGFVHCGLVDIKQQKKNEKKTKCKLALFSTKFRKASKQVLSKIKYK